MKARLRAKTTSELSFCCNDIASRIPSISLEMTSFIASLGSGLNDYITALDKFIDLDEIVKVIEASEKDGELSTLQDSLDKLTEWLSVKGGNEQLILANRIFELTKNAHSIIKLLNVQDIYVVNSALKLLEELSSLIPRAVLDTVLKKPEVVGFMVSNLEKYKAVFVRNQCITLLSGLASKSRELQTILVFQGGVEALLALVIEEVGSSHEGDIPLKALRCLSSMTENDKCIKYMREADSLLILNQFIEATIDIAQNPTDDKSVSSWTQFDVAIEIACTLIPNVPTNSATFLFDVLCAVVTDAMIPLSTRIGIVKLFTESSNIEWVRTSINDDEHSEPATWKFLLALPDVDVTLQNAICDLFEVLSRHPIHPSTFEISDTSPIVTLSRMLPLPSAVTVLTFFAQSAAGRDALLLYRPRGSLGLLEIVIKMAETGDVKAMQLLSVWSPKIKNDLLTNLSFVVRMQEFVKLKNAHALVLLCVIGGDALGDLVASVASLEEMDALFDSLDTASQVRAECKKVMLLKYLGTVQVRANENEVMRECDRLREENAQLKRMVASNLLTHRDHSSRRLEIAESSMHAFKSKCITLEVEISRLKLQIEAFRIAAAKIHS